MTSGGIHSPEDRRFAGLATQVLDDLAARDPVHATDTGDHRFDDRLPDLTHLGAAEFARVLRRHQVTLDRVDELSLSRGAAADLAILHAGVAARIFDLTELREHTWNPLLWNPARALLQLVQRDFAPAEQRAAALRARLRAVPEFLDHARATLTDMPPQHVRTAIRQLTHLAPTLAAAAGPVAHQPGIDAASAAARSAVAGHVAWLRDQLATSTRPAALGESAYQRVLHHHLGTELSVAALLAAAESELDEIWELLAETAARHRRSVPDALAGLAADPLTNDTVLAAARSGYDAAVRFATERELVSLPDLDVRIEVMPPAFRGVAVAYCDAPGAAEPVALPTVIAVAPTPDDWDRERTASFYREYTRAAVANLMVHEAVPGHALQLAAARAAPAPTGVRVALPSGTFIEGWAVVAEELMAAGGFSAPGVSRTELRLQQLKMRLRSTLNAILDARFHTQGLSEAEARRLLSERGLQEDGEITGKWQRVQLTSGQLASYFVGRREVSGVLADLSAAHPQWQPRQVHDTVIGQGSVPPQVLRGILALPPA